MIAVDTSVMEGDPRVTLSVECYIPLNVAASLTQLSNTQFMMGSNDFGHRTNLAAKRKTKRSKRSDEEKALKSSHTVGLHFLSNFR